MRNFLFLIFCTFLFCQCTITKRVHKAGWHIDSKKGWKTSSSENEKSTSLNERIPITLKIETQYISKPSEQKSTVKFDSKTSKNKVRNKNPELSKEKSGIKLNQRKTDASKKLNVDYKDQTAEKTDNDDLEDEEEKKERKKPFWLFLLVTISILLVGSVFIGLIWMFAYTSMIYGAFFGSVLLEILAGVIVSIPTLAIYYGFFYLIFYIFYGKDPYYSSKKEFNSAFWKIASIFLAVFAGLILILIFVVLANIL